MEKKNNIFINYLYNASYSLLNVIIPIITIPYVSRVLLATGVGSVSYAQNIVTYFVLVASLGIPNYGIREIAAGGNDLEKRSKIFFEILFINIVSTLFSFVLYLLFICLYGAELENILLYYIFGITILLNAFNIDWFYRGIEEFKYITMRSCFVKLCSLAAIFCFVHKQEDIYVYALILSLSTSVNYIFNILHVNKYVRFTQISLRQCLKRIKSISLMFATAVAVEIYAQVDTTMIGIISGTVYVGYYANVIKLTRIVATIIAAIGAVILPRLTSYYVNKDYHGMSELVKKIVEYILYISIPAMAGLITLSKYIVLVLFGNDFIPSVLTLRILAVLIPILCVGNIFGTQLLTVLHKEKDLSISVFAGAFVNVLLNSFLIPQYQQNGAAAASVMTELTVLIVQILVTRSLVKVKINFFTIIKTVMQTISMVIVLLIIQTFNVSNLVCLSVSVCVGPIIYFIAGIVLKNELNQELIYKLRKKYENK